MQGLDYIASSHRLSNVVCTTAFQFTVEKTVLAITQNNASEFDECTEILKINKQLKIKHFERGLYDI